MVEIGDDVCVTVTGVHPVAMADAFDHALAAALRLRRELTTTTDE